MDRINNLNYMNNIVNTVCEIGTVQDVQMYDNGFISVSGITDDGRKISVVITEDKE